MEVYLSFLTSYFDTWVFKKILIKYTGIYPGEEGSEFRCSTISNLKDNNDSFVCRDWDMFEKLKEIKALGAEVVIGRANGQTTSMSSPKSWTVG